MFVLYKIKDIIDLSSDYLHLTTREGVIIQLDQKYVGKVLKGEGLCITIYELQINDIVLINDLQQCFIQFTLVLFKPFPGELLTGTIKKCSTEGITVSLNFIEAFIPKILLFEQSYLQFSRSDQSEQTFVWRYEDNDLIFDLGQQINFKVFSFILPEEDNVLPELIVTSTQGTANEDGLGLSIWWKELKE